MNKNQKLGPFKIKKTLAKGGMGEILLAYDPVCQREIAIKKIRDDLKDNEAIHKRFLKEAKITAKLTHPGIISIFSIHHEGEELYYTMPYVDGQSLKKILTQKPLKNVGELISIFYQICQTIAFAHEKNVIHRDLKPGNILVGPHGEVLVLDWGLAIEHLDKDIPLSQELPDDPEMTAAGKIVGTLAYMAPERILNQKATFLTDIYALGVLLYMMLTGAYPFYRKTLKEAKKNLEHENFKPPQEIAPYREIPPTLVQIVKKCLEKEPSDRYQNMLQLIDDLKLHLEGKPIWVKTKGLSLKKKQDWEIEENVLLSPHFAVTQTGEGSQWVHLKIAKNSFGDTIRIEADVTIEPQCEGIGFLINIPEPSMRKNVVDGFCFWLGSQEKKHSTLYHDTIEIARFDDLFLKPNETYRICIEKYDDQIHLKINDAVYYTYLSYLPLLGTHIGILSKDLNFKCSQFSVLTSSLNLSVSCLKIPDAFLSNKQFKKALSEYLRIAESFSGYPEGREALFKAGITLLEEAKNTKDSKKSHRLYFDALEAFGRLYQTPAAPLEYLGKSLVYKALKEDSEEIKCLELALRRYFNHPMISKVGHHILYRMHQTAKTNRKSAYFLMLIALRHLNSLMHTEETFRLFHRVTTHWENVYFIGVKSHFESIEDLKETDIVDAFAISLCFWTSSSYLLAEWISHLKNEELLSDALFALVEIGSYDLAFHLLKSHPVDPYLEIIRLFHQEGADEAIKALFALKPLEISHSLLRTVLYLMQRCILSDCEEKVFVLKQYISGFNLAKDEQIACEAYEIWAFLKEEKYSEAAKCFDRYPLTLLNQESTLLHSLYACFLAATEGESIAQIHLSGVTETLYPKSFALLGHEITDKISENPTWISQSFMWERRKLYQILTLYYQCLDNPSLETLYRSCEKKEYLNVQV